MEIGGVEIVLLVPRSGRENDVGVERRRIHPQVEVHHEVELAPRTLVCVLDLAGGALCCLVGDGVVVGAEVVPQEVLVALGTRHQCVAAPDVPHAGPVLRSVRVLDREPQLPAADLVGDPLHDLIVVLRSGFRRLFDQLEAVYRELGIEGKPAKPHRADLLVDRVPSREITFGERVVVSEPPLVAPLVGVDVVERRRVLEPRRLEPVGGEGDARPRSGRRELLLTHVVGQSSSVHTDGAREHQPGYRAAVHQVVVIPVVDSRADDDRALAVGGLGIGGKLLSESHYGLLCDAGVALLPGGSVGVRSVVVTVGVVTREAAGDAELGHEQVEGCGDRDPSPRGLDVAYGDATASHDVIGEV